MNTLVRAPIAFFLALALSCCGTERAPAGMPEGRPSDAPAVMLSTNDLKDKRIGVVMGSVYDSFATRTYPQATVLQFDSPADLRLAVLASLHCAGLSESINYYPDNGRGRLQVVLKSK